MKKRRVLTVLMVATFVFSIPFMAYAVLPTVPQKINYQGYLTDSGGTPLTGAYEMVFSLCDAASDGSCPWTETQSVSVNKGILSVTLGAVTPITLSFDAQYYLDIQVGGEQMTARQPLTSVGYAFRAQTANSAATVTNGVYTSGSYADPAWISSLAGSKISGAVASATTADKCNNRHLGYEFQRQSCR